jgi:YhcH/YjgK/YiaL family protein
MVIDYIDKLSLYFQSDWVSEVESFLANIVNTPDGNYPIIGEELFCKVMTYKTKINEFITESHKDYVDIQVVFEGEEIIYIHNIELLNVKDEYDNSIDCIFYNLASIEPRVKVTMKPGLMGIFFPQDAHTTQIATNSEVISIRKAVFKVHRTFFN